MRVRVRQAVVEHGIPLVRELVETTPDDVVKGTKSEANNWQKGCPHI
jgi:hypothetical protein